MKILLLVAITLVVVANEGSVWCANTTARSLSTAEIVEPNVTERQITSASLTTVTIPKSEVPSTSAPVASVEPVNSVKVYPVILDIQPLNIEANEPQPAKTASALQVRVNYSPVTTATVVSSPEHSTEGNDDNDSVIAQRMLDNPGINGAIDAILVIVALQTMLGLGCTMDFQMVLEHVKNPIGEET